MPTLTQREIQQQGFDWNSCVRVNVFSGRTLMSTQRAVSCAINSKPFRVYKSLRNTETNMVDMRWCNLEDVMVYLDRHFAENAAQALTKTTRHIVLVIRDGDNGKRHADPPEVYHFVNSPGGYEAAKDKAMEVIERLAASGRL